MCAVTVLMPWQITKASTGRDIVADKKSDLLAELRSIIRPTKNKPK
jgi:hypothetical protein